MRASVVTRHGGPEVLEYQELPDPKAGPGEAVVGLTAGGVNFIDVYNRNGMYPTSPPFVGGVEGAGTVLEVGEGVTELTPGDRVAWAGAPGGYADRVALPAARLVKVPDGVSDETAAATMLQGMTAHYLVRSTYRIGDGDTALVHAAAGGMGLLLTQLVKLLGGRVIGTVSTEEKERLAREAGADEIIRYTEAEVAPAVRDLTGGRGVDVVYDGVGADTFEASLASLRPRGTLALYGAASGPVPPFDLQRLNPAGSLFVTRPSLVHHVAAREELLERAEEVLGWVAGGALKIHIGGRYPLAEAGKAHEDLEGRRTTGKLLIIP
ncbi:MAG: zinc-binding dehydrogenase [Streptosporangiales bacterium]|nr:zinc-binding dehydrogenase [Streptosporangiales bacterium]